ncbi:MAG: YceI family protein [Rudaea sp.]
MNLRTTLAAILTIATAPLQATTYTLEPKHTQGVVSWSHLGFSNPTAQFSGVAGTLQYDPADPAAASVSVTIPIARLATGVPDLDDYFREKTFFDLAAFPNATFRSTKIERGGTPGSLRVTGELTLRGVTKAVTLDAVLNKIGINPRNQLPTIGFAATTTLNRSDFGLGKFVPQVSDAVAIRITAEAAEAKAYAEQLRKEAEEEARDAKTAASNGAVPAQPPANAPPKH